MISTNIHQNTVSKQDTKVGEAVKKGFALTKLIHQLIREYGTYAHNNFDVDIDKFSLTDKKLLIAYLESAEMFEWACESPSRIETMFEEHAKYIQELINDECYVVFCEAMEERGMSYTRHPNNDEVYWYKR